MTSGFASSLCSSVSGVLLQCTSQAGTSAKLYRRAHTPGSILHPSVLPGSSGTPAIVPLIHILLTVTLPSFQEPWSVCKHEASSLQ